MRWNEDLGAVIEGHAVERQVAIVERFDLASQEDETDDLSWEDASFAEREID